MLSCALTSGYSECETTPVRLKLFYIYFAFCSKVRDCVPGDFTDNLKQKKKKKGTIAVWH